MVSFTEDVVNVCFLKKLEEVPAIINQRATRVRRDRCWIIDHGFGIGFNIKFFKTKVRSSRRLQSSAAIEWVIPNFLVKPPIHEPELSLMSPPALAFLRLLWRTDSSMFNL